MATTIASLLSGTSLNANSALAPPPLSLKSNITGFFAPAANQDSFTSSSSVTFISSSAQAMVSQESFQARAVAILNQSKPPTVNDFRAVVQGVVTGFNALRQSLANAAAANANFRASQRSAATLSSIDRTLANNPKEFVASLKNVGIVQQSNGSLTYNQNQLTKAYASDSQGALATVASFASQVSAAANSASPATADDEKKAQDAAARRAADAKRRQAAAQEAAQAAAQQPPQPVAAQAPQPAAAPAPQPILTQDPQPIAAAAAQTDATQQPASPLSGASGYTAFTAVTTYLAVSAL